MSDILKGAARGLTADWLGSPVDMAVTGTNLGIAGAGYLAHKLRLMKQPPDLIDPASVPFSSDWLSKGTPLEDTGSAGYTAGRFTGNLAPGIRAIAAKARAPRHGQTNALYPGGRDDLLLSHSTSPNDLISSHPKEFYHLSSAITKDRIPDDFGPVSFILNPKKFEPRTSSTTISNRDAYTPRWKQSHAGGRYDPKDVPIRTLELENELKYWRAEQARYPDEGWVKRELSRVEQELAETLKKDVQKEAVKRLTDRFVDSWTKGGRSLEGVTPANVSFRNKTNQSLPQPDVDSAHKMSIQQSPRFQSFKHYEKHPAGALTLSNDTDLPERITDRADDQIREVFGKLYTTNPGEIVKPFSNFHGHKRYEVAKRLAALTKKDIERGAKSGTISIADETGSVRPITADELKHHVALMRNSLQTFKEAPSNYAEVKTFGATPINKETVAAIYVQPGQHKDTIAKLREYAQKRGVPLIEGTRNSAADFEKVVQEQNWVQRPR